MTDAATATTDWLTKRRRYKRLMYGSLLAGIIGLFVGSYFDQFLAGVIVYWAGFFGMIGTWQFR